MTFKFTPELESKLSSFVPAPVKGVTDKCGKPVADSFTTLHLNLCGDDEASPFGTLLAQLYTDALAGAVKAVCASAGCSDVIVCVPDDSCDALVSAIGGKSVKLRRSPVLRAADAVCYSAETGIVRFRPNIKGLPGQVLDVESLLWCAGFDGKLVSVISGDEAVIGCVAEGEKLSDASGKFYLIGGNAGVMAAAVPVADKTWLSDSVKVYTSADCIADVAASLMTCARNDSCKACVLGREGTRQMAAFFSDITAGKGKRETLALIRDIAPIIESGALCPNGKAAAKLAMSILEVGAAELEAHIVKKKCAAGVCKAFLSLAIDPSLCSGCCDCMDECPEDAIEGKSGFIHMIDPDMCTKCGKCVAVCPENAIVSGGSFRVPKKLTRVGRF